MPADRIALRAGRAPAMPCAGMPASASRWRFNETSDPNRQGGNALRSLSIGRGATENSSFPAGSG